MAQRKAVEQCLTWMADEQTVHETSPYGSNLASVTEALKEQRHRTKVVAEYSKEAEKVSRDTKDESRKEQIDSSYRDLNAIAKKRLGCLENIEQIAGLEETVGAVSVHFAERAVSLVADAAEHHDPSVPDDRGEGIARTAHSSILAVQTNWKWISTLVRCTDTHLQHAANYHQFFHEIQENEHWMPIELRKVQDLVLTNDLKGERECASRLLMELKTVLTIFLHWEGKVNRLFDRSRSLIPVHERSQKLDHLRPILAMCDYNTNDINIRENEELTLLDNTRSQSWLVRNMHGEESQVPSVICLIPPPYPRAVQSALRLLLQLLGIWTNNVKRIGITLIEFLLLVFRDWTKDEENYLKAMDEPTKKEVNRLVDYLESSLVKYWAEYPDFKVLQGRFNRLRDLLDQEGEAKYRDSEMGKALVVSLGTVEQLLEKYKELWRYWETYKILVETRRHPELMLICSRWEELQWIDTEELLKRWHIGFDFDKENKGAEELIVPEETDTVDTMPNGYDEESTAEMNIERALESAAAERFSQSEQEEKKTFTITGVIDPRTEEEVSLDRAVELGVINQSTGEYVNPSTGESLPIPVAMNAGRIKVEFTSTRKTAEKHKDIGLITIKTQKESRPYTVKGVIDIATDQQLSVDEASAMGIIDQNKGTYRRNSTEMSLADALDSGLLVVEFDKDAVVTEPEIEVKTYAVHAVVDQRHKKRIPFAEAVRAGLIHPETGAYHHNLDREDIYIGDAIKKGFVKATVVKDPSTMDIAPENKMVVDRLASVKQKLLGPMKAMAALKKADGATSETVITETQMLRMRMDRLILEAEAESRDSRRPALWGHVCRTCLPLQMLMLLLLGMACLVPMAGEESGCALANNLENSLSIMLKHSHGPPPF